MILELISIFQVGFLLGVTLSEKEMGLQLEEEGLHGKRRGMNKTDCHHAEQKMMH